MQEQTQPIGYLFGGSISYYEQKDVEKFVDNLTSEQSFFVVSQALQMAYSKGIFSLNESEIISKSLRILTKSTDEKTPTE